MSSSFPVTSRYYLIPTATFTSEAGKEYAYLLRRFLVKGEDLDLFEEITVKEGDRLDTITARTPSLGDPLQFWRVCDANNAMRPDDLETPGRKLRITLPEGMRSRPA